MEWVGHAACQLVGDNARSELPELLAIAAHLPLEASASASEYRCSRCCVPRSLMTKLVIEINTFDPSAERVL